MIIDFHDGNPPDIAVLMPILDDNGTDDLKILRGSLRNESPIVELSVIGRPNDKSFDVIFYTKQWSVI